MKIKITTLLITISFFSFSQEKTLKEKVKDSIKSVTANYKDDLLNKDATKKPLTYNPKMLNMLISEHIGSYYTEASDVSLQTFSASLNTEDDTFDFGYNYDFRNGKKTKRLKYLGYIGFSLKSDKKFGAIISKGEFNNENFVIKAKATYFRKGSIFYDKEKGVKDGLKEIVSKKRDTLVKNKKKTIDKYISEDFEKDYSTRSDTYKYRNLAKKTLEKDLEALGTEKYYEYYEALATEEKDFIEENDLYKAISSSWISLEINIPVLDNTYNLVDNLSNTSMIDTVGFRPLEAKLSFSYFKKYKKHYSNFWSLQLRVFNNNNIIAENISESKLSNIITQNDGSLVTDISKSTSVYVTNGFDPFPTGALSVENIRYLYKNMIGLSGAVEINVGKNYSPFNWKIGIPVSLKNKEGKSNISFELQWREINHNRFVGLKAGFNFGSFIN